MQPPHEPAGQQEQCEAVGERRPAQPGAEPQQHRGGERARRAPHDVEQQIPEAGDPGRRVELRQLQRQRELPAEEGGDEDRGGARQAAAERDGKRQPERGVEEKVGERVPAPPVQWRWLGQQGREQILAFRQWPETQRVERAIGDEGGDEKRRDERPPGGDEGQ
jgi:hypothetical protein